ncbi:YdiU family protein [Oleiagrimonas sp. C23AA]|uniref:protein adenylyltransferase SelO n=1 Tax=Oleiagrimonas sp. C23AA TaxID=2719047 RepID=UPI0014209AA3|nr:YdiU family protein [Oleiagrimonas sp. C23AA]NII09614.1 YdiU family protein [Oleiagrimonas sp. C23AA]
MPALNFDNLFVRELPADASREPGPRAVEGAFFTPLDPTPVAQANMLAWWPEVASALGLDDADMQHPDMARVLGGSAVLDGMQPYASVYGGHQFGHWAGQLGDGRAIHLGEVIGRDGERWDMQLKGAGPTPYSRGADGRAVLRSSLREFVCSEAMHYLGVPTTRALSLVDTGEHVVRDMFYDGHPKAEPGAVVCRVAPSFVRFGHFELPASRGDIDLLSRLVDVVIGRDFPHIGVSQPHARGDWFAEICQRTARMVAHWMRVGFVHGVMNTDNMSVLGLTIDYGPYGFIDEYDPDFTPNTTDAPSGRYRFSHQPRVAYWNLTRLAGALAPLFGDDVEPLHAGLALYERELAACERAFTAAKLGLTQADEDDMARMQQFKALLARGRMDMTLAFRALASLNPEAPDITIFGNAFYDMAARDAVGTDLQQWLTAYAERVLAQDLPASERRQRMDHANPWMLPRNYLTQQAIEAAELGDLQELQTLMQAVRQPYREQPDQARFAAPRPAWATHRAGCSMLSCSS